MKKTIFLITAVIIVLAAAFTVLSYYNENLDILKLFHGDTSETVSFGSETSAEGNTGEQDNAENESISIAIIDPLEAMTGKESADTGETTAVAASVEETAPAGYEGKVIALSFDDGPDMRYTSSTSRILDILEENDAKATFFIQAIQLTYPDIANEATGESFGDRNKKTLKRAYDMGMEIGTHTFDHPDLNKKSEEEITEQFEHSVRMINEITGGEVKILRPPYGNANDTVLSVLNVPLFGWDVDSEDWKSQDPDMIYDKVMSDVRDGSIILMHDIYNSTAEAVARIVPALIDEGYMITTVSELFRLKGIEPEPHHMYLDAR